MSFRPINFFISFIKTPRYSVGVRILKLLQVTGRTYSIIVWSALVRFYRDNCFSLASALSYTSLLSLFPIAALAFLVATKLFRIDEASLNQTTLHVLQKILPPLQEAHLENLHHEVFKTFQEVLQNVNALGSVSILLLGISGVTLLNTVESALNQIWKVRSNTGILRKITDFWAILTLGPLLVIMSFVWTTNFLSQIGIADVEEVFSFVNLFVPTVVIWFLFTLLFVKVPSKVVRVRDAARGAFVAALLFEVAKSVFAYYLVISTTYSKLYGALAVIPMFLVWLYVVWAIVLFGAEIAYVFGDEEAAPGRRGENPL